MPWRGQRSIVSAKFTILGDELEREQKGESDALKASEMQTGCQY
jgi:hypothetical protein